MKNVIFTLSFICITFLSQAQNPSLLWAKSVGGTGYDVGNAMVIDASGNVYTTGNFEGTVDFDPGAGIFNLSSAGMGDIFVLKMDASGNFVWARNMGGTKNDNAHSISVDGSGNVYTTGAFRDTADFDPGVAVLNLNGLGDNMFISKLNASGNLVYAKGIFGSVGTVGRSIALDASNNVYVTGHFQNTIDCDPGPGTFSITSVGWDDILILKLDASGNFVWANSMGDIVFDEGYSIAIDMSGNVYTAGTFKGTVDFDPGAGILNLTSTTNGDVFVSKLNASGNLVWAKSMGGTGVETCYGIALDASGNAVITGGYMGTMDFDPGAGIFNLTSAGIYDIYISKLNPAGNFVFAKSMGGSGTDQALAIALDATGNIYTTGNYSGTSDFDPGPGTYTLSGSQSVFISKLDVSGNFVWAASIAGTSGLGRGIAIDASDNIHTAGFFGGTSDFDPGAGTFNLMSAGGPDIFIQKMRPTSPTSISEFKVKGEGLLVYPNPNNGSFKIQMNDEIENGEIILINSIGEKVWTQKIKNGENNIITHGLSSGLYCYVISQNNQQVNKGKFIIR